MMELKEYQRGALDALARWLEALEEAQHASETMIEAFRQTPVDMPIPDEIRNYPKIAWEKLKENGSVATTAGEYIDRTDEANRPIPHICFKVPTGGGKTLLAAAALERLPWQRGLVLWVVPSKAIYEQTKAALWDKQHPYRKMLERAGAAASKCWKKRIHSTETTSPITSASCYWMLPATNRQRGREFLRMFRDSGRYPSFFPDIDNIFGNTEMLNEYPDLECHTERGLIKQSLFNVFKLLRPVVVLDEAHKAYGARNQIANEEFAKSINRLDPRMVIELSATPKPRD